GFSVGQSVTITGAGVGTYNGTYRITSVTQNTFTFASALSLNAAAITSASETGNTITLTTSNVPTAPSFRPGQSVVITGVASGYDGTYIIDAVPTTSSFKVTSASAGLPSVGAGGTATIPSATGGTVTLAANGTITEVGTTIGEGTLTQALDSHSVTFGGY